MKAPMRLWKLRNLEMNWGATMVMVVKETTERKARLLAAREACGVKRAAVMDPRRFSCQEITLDGQPEVLGHSVAE